MELIKSFTISKKTLNKHYTYTNIELFTELQKNGKSTVLNGFHYGNWEWIISLNSFVDYKGYAVYAKIGNTYFNSKMLKTREKFGVNFVQTSKIKFDIETDKRDNTQAMYGFLSDQSPQLSKTRYWSDFFGVKVPIHTGAEAIAKKYDMNFVYMETKKIKRGYYETTFTLITDDAKKYPDYELTDIFLRKTEEHIRKAPQYYFWTHNRFKHKDKYEEYLEMKSK